MEKLTMTTSTVEPTSVDDTIICVPTLGRVERQVTLRNLCESSKWSEVAYAVAPPEEAKALWDLGWNVMPCPAKGIANVRQWIIENTPTRYVLMVDDDLGFGRRRYDDPGKFTMILPGDTELIFDRLRAMLDQTPIVGMDSRNGGNRSPVPVATGRFWDITGLDLDVVKKEGFTMNRTKLMEDFDLQLQFSLRGYRPWRLTTHFKMDNGSNASGGCSNYRDLEMQEAAANRLKELHPDYVTVVKRRAGWGGGMGVRTDVRVSWAKAFAAGEELRRKNGEPLEPEPDWSNLAPDWELF